jgi:hypothetical protein
MHPTFNADNTGGLNYIKNTNTPIAKKIHGAYPNPFKQSTLIRYTLPTQSDVILQVFDITGRQVATLIDDMQNQGVYSIKFTPDRQNVSQGIYLARLVIKPTTGINTVKTIKLILTK